MQLIIYLLLLNKINKIFIVVYVQYYCIFTEIQLTPALSQQGLASSDSGDTNDSEIEVIMVNNTDMAIGDVRSSAHEVDVDHDSHLVGKKKRKNIYLTESQQEEVREFLIRNDGLYNKKRELWQYPTRKTNSGKNLHVL